MGATTSGVRINGAALRAIRSRTINPHTGKPWTVSGLAATVGCRQPHMTLIEQDARQPSVTLVTKIASALDVVPAAILWAPPRQGRATDEAVA